VLYNEFVRTYGTVYGRDGFTGDVHNDGTGCERYSCLYTAELCHHLPVIQLVSFLECAHVSSEQSPVQYCAALRDERLLVA